MGRFLDLMTGKTYHFAQASGKDIDKGLSDELIITPKALAHSHMMCNTSIPLVLPSVFNTKSALWVQHPHVFLIPDNGYFFPNRCSNIQAQLFAYVKTNADLTGEVCLVDVALQKIVAHSNIAFTNHHYACIATPMFELEAGKAYTLALRRTSGNHRHQVLLKAATLTLKLMSV